MESKTTDLLLNVPVIYSAGDAGAPAFNLGEMLNKGIDIAVYYYFDVGEVNLEIGVIFQPTKMK